MQAVFLRILNMSLSAAAVIAVVALARLFLRKAPKKWSYLLWSVVGFRLCCPVSFRAAFSVFRLAPRLASEVVTPPTVYAPVFSAPAASSAPVPAATAAPVIPIPAEPLPIPSGAGAAAPVVNSVDPIQIWTAVGTVLWLLGFASLLAYAVVSFLRLRRKLTGAVLASDGVWETDRIRSPFILGLLRPQIYLPLGVSGEARAYVLAHERYHLRCRDYLVKPFAFLLLAVHWFNPLVWLAFFLMSRDMEMRCDEHVLGRGESNAKAYSYSLLGFASEKRFPRPSPLAFGETDVKRRIKNVLNWKKPRTWVTIAAVIVCVIVVAACAANPKEDDEPAGNADPGVPSETSAFSPAMEQALAENWAAWNAKGAQEQSLSSTLPGSVSREFVSWADACAFFGSSPWNPLEGDAELEQMNWAGADVITPWQNALMHARVTAAGPETGGVAAASIAAGYQYRGTRVTLTAATEGSLPDMGTAQPRQPLAGISAYDRTDPEGKWNATDYRFTKDGYDYAVSVIAEGDEALRLANAYVLRALFAAPVAVRVALPDGTVVPQEAVDWALELAQRDVMQYSALGAQGTAGKYAVLDAKLTGLTQLSTGTASNTVSVNMYRAQWRILTDHPENVVMAGGMSMEDGWLTEQGSTGDQYIILYHTDDSGWQRLTGITALTVQEEYGTPEMLEKYGSAETAACMELYREIVQKQASPLTVSSENGAMYIVPYTMLRFSETWTEQGWLAADGVPLETVQIVSAVPQLRLGADGLTYAYGPGTARVGGLRVYTPDLSELLLTDADNAALTALEPGLYYCVQTVVQTGRYIESEGRSETTGLDCIFRLIVPNPNPVSGGELRALQQEDPARYEALMRGWMEEVSIIGETFVSDLGEAGDWADVREQFAGAWLGKYLNASPNNPFACADGGIASLADNISAVSLTGNPRRLIFDVTLALGPWNEENFLFARMGWAMKDETGLCRISTEACLVSDDDVHWRVESLNSGGGDGWGCRQLFSGPGGTKGGWTVDMTLAYVLEGEDPHGIALLQFAPNLNWSAMDEGQFSAVTERLRLAAQTEPEPDYGPDFRLWCDLYMLWGMKNTDGAYAELFLDGPESLLALSYRTDPETFEAALAEMDEQTQATVRASMRTW